MLRTYIFLNYKLAFLADKQKVLNSKSPVSASIIVIKSHVSSKIHIFTFLSFLGKVFFFAFCQQLQQLMVNTHYTIRLYFVHSTDIFSKLRKISLIWLVLLILSYGVFFLLKSTFYFFISAPIYFNSICVYVGGGGNIFSFPLSL